LPISGREDFLEYHRQYIYQGWLWKNINMYMMK
jgi:hypothetical protein